MKVTVAIEISEKTLENVLSDAGIEYWADVESWPATADLVYGQKDAIIRDVEGDGKAHVLNRQALILGLERMSIDAPEHFAEIVSGDYDSNTGDVLVQCALFGDIVYG